jgi:hypothetical protein
MSKKTLLSILSNIFGKAFDIVFGIIGGMYCALILSLIATFLYRVSYLSLFSLFGLILFIGTVCLTAGIIKKSYFRLIALPIFVIFTGDESGQNIVEWSMGPAIICSFFSLFLMIYAVLSENSYAAIGGSLLFIVYFTIFPKQIEELIKKQL